MYGAMMQYPGGFGQWLNAATIIVSDNYEVAIIGDPAAEATLDLLDEVNDRYRPYHILAVGHRDSAVPLLHDRSPIDNRATAYVCQNFTCQMPTADPQELAVQLANS